MNKYTTDGIFNLCRSSELLVESMSNSQIEDAVLQYAFGIERICKGVLFSINPIFIYESQKFKDIVSELYADKLTSAASKEFETGSSIRVVAMKDSIVYASYFSDAVAQNKDVFHNLREYRDILVHRTLDEFSHDEVKQWLAGVYFPSVKSLADDLGIEQSKVFGERANELNQFALNAKHQEALSNQVAEILQSRKDNWASIKSDELSANAARITRLDLSQKRDTYDNAYQSYKCPACENEAVLEFEVDVEGDQHDWHVNGPFAVELRCHYCSLSINNYEQLGYLEVEDWSQWG